MTIVQLVNAYGPRTGGIRTHVDNVRRRYHARGIEPVLVRPDAASSSGADEYGRVYTIRSPRFWLNRDYRNIWSHRAVLAVLDEVRPDAVEILDKYTLPALAPRLRRRSLPTLGFSSERLSDVVAPYLGAARPTQAAVRRYNAWFASRFETVVCHSRYAAAELREVGARNLVCVPLGVDLERFCPARRDERLRAELLGDREILLLYVGRLVREKRVGLLAELMRRVAGRRFRLVVAGSGPADVRDRLAAAPDTTLLEFVADRDRLAALYASCDLFVFPSPIETFALSVLEALASGCRVLASVGGAVPEVVPAGAGVLARPTSASFAAGLDVALRLDPETAARAARRRAERFTWERNVAAVLALHEEAKRR